ncbi:FAD-dependent oxidoreductase [Mycetocola sp. JXN-3]|uniref:FAD-dependent oxidoreductase n=1 Tax=Mycetocola sp. JXN-3 TaxID=2116510 RepID=UPI00165D15F6|nr:FAD-dependent oxidoreductase [Mycetocola sp. JXN-3]
MSARLDRLLGRVTMYRLVLLVLLALWVIAAVLSLAGVLAFPILGLVLSLVVAVVVGWVSNRVFALIWRVTPHGESSLVTALILVFLFFPLPTIESQGMLALAVAAANLSKYLLAWRGRHVFNPVAAGAMVVATTGIGGAVWWIATPALFIPLILGAALVLHRARAWDIALPVIVIGVVGTLLKLVSTGADPLGAGWTALASYPYLFLGAFMMSEPLTAPPRRRWRMLVSAIVGLVSLIPLNLGVLAMSPELALLVGNAVAFGFGPRSRVRLTLEARAEHAGGIADLSFVPERPLRLRPGQYLELSIPHRGADGRGLRRVFSVASAPGSSAVRIITRVEEWASSFKQALLALEPGTHVAVSAVGGDFTVRGGADELWLANGVGLTPFLAAADARTARPASGPTLIWALRAGEDPVWAEPVLRRGGVRVLIVGPESLGLDGALPEGWLYAGTRVDEHALAIARPAGRPTHAYVAGSPAFVVSASRAARSHGVHRVRTDRFIGY